MVNKYMMFFPPLTNLRNNRILAGSKLGQGHELSSIILDYLNHELW